TGCSSGLGRAIATAVLEAGHRAVITARNPAKLADLADAYPDTALSLALDVCDPAQVTSVIQQTEEAFGGIDVLVNNAGYGYRSAVEEGEADQVQQLFETNFFAVADLIKQVLPGMRARRAGTIVNM